MGRRCHKGKSCGATCISRRKICLIELSKVGESFNNVRQELQISPPSKPSKQIFRISPESRKAAAEIIAKYAKGEPATTSLMEKLAKKNGMELVGLKNRLKREDSLARKIETTRHKFGGDANKAAQSMSDINRYTMQVPPGKFGASVKDVLSNLEKQGYSLRIKNYWSPDAGPYRGLNVALTAPDGRKIELQFHTADSLKVKSSTHKDYEEYRISKDNVRRREIWDRMVALAKTIPMPRGALDIGSPEELIKRQFEPI